jgi:ornithine lipid ester-linked acyl 2-hydroxylase
MVNNIFVLVIIVITIIILYMLHQYLHHNIYSTANIINSFFSKYCTDPMIFDPKIFPWTQHFRNNWKNIREEYIRYNQYFIVPSHNQINKTVASCDTNNKWKTLYLRIFNKNTKIANFFPMTMNLINLCPCTLAFFSILEPGARLTPHIGIYKGVIRYHLGLIVPKEWQKCFIKVDQTKLHWSEGSDIMFDDMFLHHAENNTNEPRVILFLDIKRDFHNVFLNITNAFFLNFVKSNDVLNDTITNANSFKKKFKF